VFASCIDVDAALTTTTMAYDPPARKDECKEARKLLGTDYLDRRLEVGL